jgi:hydroxyethylthiazole kinase
LGCLNKIRLRGGAIRANPLNLIRLIPAEESAMTDNSKTIIAPSTGAQTQREQVVAQVSIVLAQLRARKPRIHAITSAVAGPLTANGLLALGVTPSLSVDREEIADFVAGADGILLNMGMLDQERRVSLPRAAAAAQSAGKPVVLDPVFADRSASRRALALELLATHPAIVKMNAQEALAFAASLAPETVQIITGAQDVIRLGNRHITLTNGTPLLAQITATGCLLGAILAACHAVEADGFIASIAGVSIFNIAAENAAEHCAGPGSFSVSLMDALANLTPAMIERQIKGDFANARL